MTREEALKILRKDLLSNLADYYSSEELQDAIDTIVSLPSLPSNLDEAVEEVMPISYGSLEVDCYGGSEPVYSREQMKEIFKAGAEWMAGRGWIDDGSMPPETKQESDTL